MDYLMVCIAAAGAACLTLVSGFGLGTLLMPVFALFFPLHVAVAATAVVHLFNNVFKLFLVGRYADVRTTLRFAVPAGFTAVLGALFLGFLTGMAPLVTYRLEGSMHEITPDKLVIAVLLAFFSYVELSRRFAPLRFKPELMPLGGAVSGFFGGLSGLQGAMRAPFLIKAAPSKEAFIANSALSAVVVDVLRVAVYGATFYWRDFALVEKGAGACLVLAATAAAFAGSMLGKRVMMKVTLRAVHVTVGVMLMLIAAALGAGLI